VFNIRRFLVRSFAPIAFVVSAISPGCECDSAVAKRAPPAPQMLECVGQRARNLSPPLTSKTVDAASIPTSFASTSNGDSALSMNLATLRGRGGMGPNLTVSYSSSGDEGFLGVGFSISAGSAITRCPRSFPVDGQQQAVQYDESDYVSLCLDGKRLVIVAENNGETLFRTIPDTQVKVVGYLEDPATSHFEVHSPNGSAAIFGATAETRPMAKGNMPRAWLLGEQKDARGNGTHYDWCFATNEEEGFVAEYALNQITWSRFGDEEPTRSITFVHGVKEEPRHVYSQGMGFQQSLRLDEIQAYSGKTLAQRFTFGYEQGETTGRTRLTSVERCGSNAACTLPTRLQYGKSALAFEKFVTNLDAPMSKYASPILADFTNDGLPDWLVPDTTPSSTTGNPITVWSLARNTGNGFAAPKVVFSQEWPFVQDADGPSDPALLQPELGTVIQYNADNDQLADILLHDVNNNRQNHVILASKADVTFQEIDTQIARPFPIGPTPKGLLGAGGAIHLFDADGDQIADLLSCDDHGSTPETALFSAWTLHLWKPGGYEKGGENVPALEGYPCGSKMYTLDTNADGITDLVLPGMVEQAGMRVEYTGTFSVFRRRSLDTWDVFDIGLPTPVNGGSIVFGDYNGDGLPDALGADSSGNLVTWTNTGKGFVKQPENALDWDGSVSQAKYLHLASAADFDQNGKSDILLPMVDAISPNVPRWVILRATGAKNAFQFERVESGIPFEPLLADAITLADPHGPRIGDVNGDGAPDVALFLGNKLHIFKNLAADADVLVGFSDGRNEHDPDDPAFVPNVLIEYAHLIDASKTTGQSSQETDFYISQSDPTNDCNYPRHCVVGSKRVVKQYAVNDGQGGGRRYGLRYRDGRYDRSGYGFLGFGERILTDSDTGGTTATFYDNRTKVEVGEHDVYPFTGQVVQQWRWVPGLATQPNPDQIEMAFTDRTLEVVPTNGGQTYFTLATQTHTRRMQGAHSGAATIEAYVSLVETLENATMLRDTVVDILDFDEFANVVEVKASTIGVEASAHITRTVKNDVGKWMLGLPGTQTECSTGSGLTACRIIKHTTNEFGEVDSEETSSNDGIDDTKLKVVYDQRDKYGNILHASATDAFGNKRESRAVYDPEGMFPVKLINALGHETTLEYDKVLGVLMKQTDPNGLTAEWIYDSLGRLELETLPNGANTTIKRTREQIGGVWRMVEHSTTSGGADDETIFDSLGRPIETLSFAPQPAGQKATRIMQRIEYDRLSGQVARQSVPIAEGTADALLKWDTFTYDALGREIRHLTPWNALTTTTYNGFLVDSTDPLLKHTVTELDRLGRPVTITDAANGKTKHAYGPFDALYLVTDPGNAVTKWKRDAFGRVRQLDEPDRGTTHYVNSGFGDMLSSTDALGRVATFDLDALGRVETRTDKLGAQVLTTSWTWDTAPNGIGRLHSVVSPDGAKTYGYNERGQTESVKLGVGSDNFAARMAYDELGHLKTLDYPQPLGMEPFGVTYDHDPHGFRIAVRDKATNDAFWELKDVDNAGRYKEELFGNGTKTVRGYHDDKQALKSITTTKGASTIQQLSYDWDPRLNLKSRTDALQPQNKTERFKVDALDRLTCAYFSPTEKTNPACHTSYGYAANGNLTSKSDVGTLFYTDPKHPHAVTNAPGETFGYDAVGNQFTRPGGVSITYTPFDLPRTITQGAKEVSFGYDGDEQRIRKTTANSETFSFEDLFEQVTTGLVKEYRYYLHSPERTIAIVTRGGAEPGTKYLHVDHIGSTETITNESGVQVEKRSFDAFGARRNSSWGASGAVVPSKTKQGFTGHDEEDEFGLLNMKGRLYDPRIARFTTTDPIIANVYNGQSFAAYSYVLNNPLTLIDPSGFMPADGVVTQPGFPDVPLPDDIVQPSPTFRAEQEIRQFLAHENDAPSIGASTPSNDVDTTGSDDVVIPVIETDHPSGPGTDDPFGVFPPDIELGYDRPITTFDQLQTGDPAGGRRTFIVEDDPGIGRDIRYAFGPKRETIMLRPRIGGEAGDDHSRAKQNLVFEGIITLATVLTPGPLDDMAAAGLRTGARAELEGAAWTPGKLLWSKGKWGEHFRKHGADVGARSASEYSGLAAEFGSAPNTGQFIDMKNGAFFYRYDPATNRVFVGTAGGKIKTFYTWDGRANDAVITSLKEAGRL
jgi:RHS repeat-associated protein